MMSSIVQPRESVLHPATRLGAVQLTVANLDRSVAFYRQVLGFQVHSHTADRVSLGAGCADLLQLVEGPGVCPLSRHSGLYHFAVLTPSRLALGQVLRSLVAHGIQLAGSDHLVSEAIYLADPDGIGVEIYWDRPRASWRYAEGRLVVGSFPLDYRGILCGLVKEPTCWQGLDPATVIGHLHLHVDQLPAALLFYRDHIGFDLMMKGDNAAFFSVGGYHHHLGVNTWAGIGALPQPPEAVGLRHFVIELPAESVRAQLIERLERGGVAVTERADGLFVRDPAQNGLLFVVK